MGLLVEYTIAAGKEAEQAAEMERFVDGLRALADDGFRYTAYATDDPTRFIGVLEFDDDLARRRFIASAPFAAYREGSKERFIAPPQVTPIRRIGTSG